MSFDHYKKTVGTANAVSTILSTHCRTQTIGPTISNQPAEVCLKFCFLSSVCPPFVHQSTKKTKRYEKRKNIIT